jgi:Flp pilus assembly protein TadD
MNDVAASKSQVLRLAQTMRVPEARSLCQQLTQTHPDDPELWFLLGALHGQLGEFSEAERCCRSALGLRPDHPALHYNLGIALARQGRMREAAASLGQAVKLDPGNAEAHADLGAVLVSQQERDSAISCFESAIRIKPDLLRAHIELGRQLLMSYRFDRLTQVLHNALERFPQNAELHFLMGVVYQEQGQIDEAEPCLRRALDLDPQHVEARASLAGTFGLRRQYETANTLLAPLVDGGNKSATTALVFATFAHRFGREQEAVTMLAHQLARDGLPDNVASKLHFALARIHDRRGEYDDAFRHFAEANRLRRAKFDRPGFSRFVEALTAAWSPASSSQLPRSTNRTTQPIFIVGMMRSGTSLVEQILASHPDVFGAGELAAMDGFARGLAARLGGVEPYPHCVRHLTADMLANMAQEYLSGVERKASGSPHFTDKMPANFLHLGLIDLMFPGARVIHCVRDPMDTCLSCYFQPFGGEHAYAYDLEDLGFYYREYERLMTHWRKVLRIPMLELRYEELVADPEPVIRRLLEFCELPWNDRCLNPHANPRAVATASHEQVQRPIHRESVGRWRYYAPHLEPLTKALGIADS